MKRKKPEANRSPKVGPPEDGSERPKLPDGRQSNQCVRTSRRDVRIIEWIDVVRLAYRYHDVDVVELNVSAWNGSFGGSTCLYVGQGDLADAAALLARFPINVEDKREVTLGAFGPNSAGGAMALQFSCRDGAGHCQLHITIEADFGLRDSLAERVELLSAIEPAALDQFVEQMRILNSSLTGSAVLVFA